MHTSSYERRITLWSVFEPQSARESAPERGLSPGVLRRARDEAGMAAVSDEIDPVRERELYDDSDVSPVLEILARQRTTVVLGDPGSGKTSLLKFLLMRWLTEAGGPLPVWIELRHYGLSGKDSSTTASLRPLRTASMPENWTNASGPAKPCYIWTRLMRYSTPRRGQQSSRRLWHLPRATPKRALWSRRGLSGTNPIVCETRDSRMPLSRTSTTNRSRTSSVSGIRRPRTIRTSARGSRRA